MRGRKIDLGPKNALSSLYELKSDESEKSEESDLEDEEQPIKLDLARGFGNITSSDEDSSSEWSFEEVPAAASFSEDLKTHSFQTVIRIQNQ